MGVLEALRIDFSSITRSYGERQRGVRGSVLGEDLSTLVTLSILSSLLQDILLLCTSSPKMNRLWKAL